MAATTELSIVIPAYNERERIRPALDEVRAYLLGASWREAEIIVVCDGCTDDTAAVCEASGVPGMRVLAYPRNQGKGHAVKTGVLASRGDVVLFADADGATPIRELDRLAQALASGHDVAIGSRRLPGARIAVPQPWRRRLLGRFFASATRRILHLDVMDTQCGFKAFRGETARFLFRQLRSPGFAFDLELLVLARQHGLSVAEIGVEWHDRTGTTVSPWRDGMRMLTTLWTLRRRADLRGTAPAPAPIPSNR